MYLPLIRKDENESSRKRTWSVAASLILLSSLLIWSQTSAHRTSEVEVGAYTFEHIKQRGGESPCLSGKAYCISFDTHTLGLGWSNRELHVTVFKAGQHDTYTQTAPIAGLWQAHISVKTEKNNPDSADIWKADIDVANTGGGANAGVPTRTVRNAFAGVAVPADMNDVLNEMCMAAQIKWNQLNGNTIGDAERQVIQDARNKVEAEKAKKAKEADDAKKAEAKKAAEDKAKADKETPAAKIEAAINKIKKGFSEESTATAAKKGKGIPNVREGVEALNPFLTSDRAAVDAVVAAKFNKLPAKGAFTPDILTQILNGENWENIPPFASGSDGTGKTDPSSPTAGTKRVQHV